MTYGTTTRGTTTTSEGYYDDSTARSKQQAERTWTTEKKKRSYRQLTHNTLQTSQGRRMKYTVCNFTSKFYVIDGNYDFDDTYSRLLNA
eukprot:1975109-Amphidinium_carterae.1